MMTGLKRMGQGLAAIVLLFTGATAQHIQPRDAAHLELALRKLNVLGSALYVGAHPDDENSAVIATLAEGRLVRTAYLSMTRGEGGQNLIGPEQGTLMGMIRTQELLAARRIDGGEQYFTRAIDFGYSKTSKETISFWGREKIVSDIVWIIRSFRPDVIMTRFSDTLGGHGNHLASAILAEEAFDKAGDPSQFPEQLRFVKPWKPKRIVFNIFRWSGGVAPTSNSVRLDVGGYNPLLGKSYTEISGLSRSMHKSQGVGSGQYRGVVWQYFEPTKGERATADLFDGVNTTWSRVKGGERVGSILKQAQDSFRADDPSASVPLLVRALHELNTLGPDPWVEQKRKELTKGILGCCGIWTDALATTYEVSPGASIPITVSAINRSAVSVSLERVHAVFGTDTVLTAALKNNDPSNLKLTLRIPRDQPLSQPYWLETEPAHNSYGVSDQRLIGLPENPPALTVGVTFRIGGESIPVRIPVQYRWIDPVAGEQYRPVIVVPPVAVNLVNATVVVPDDSEREVRVIVRGTGTKHSGEVHLDLPESWSVSPQSVPFSLAGGNREIAAMFRIKPLQGAVNGSFTAIARLGGETIDRGMTTINYPHIPIQTLFPRSTGKLVRVDLKTGGKRIGYIVGSGDGIPDALRQVGYDVTLLSDEDLESADLSSYDAIVAGVRAYNTREKLPALQERLMAYVRNGGTYVVQYMTPRRQGTDAMGPYPFTISRDRVTDENANMHFLEPRHRLLNIPNKITQADFSGWIQERGLYFANQWDPRYQTVLECRDAGEAQLPGGLLYAHVGKGAYVFTGYSFFRQLPAGVPGAFRLFSNILAAR